MTNQLARTVLGKPPWVTSWKAKLGVFGHLSMSSHEITNEKHDLIIDAGTVVLVTHKFLSSQCRCLY